MKAKSTDSPHSMRSFSLSRSHNANFKTLLRTISDPNLNAPITVVVGAGVSMDSGFPSWEALLDRLAEKIKDEKSRELILSDSSDGLLRKAEYLLQMLLLEKGSGTDKQLVTDALYRDSTETIPGPAANSLALLLSQLSKRVRVATTNFDDVIEVAVQRNSSAKAIVTSHTLDDAEEWLKKRGRNVMHLHGYLPRSGDAQGDTILSESSFLKHGPRVRDLLQKCLESGPVIFLGLSLTDPNLVGPLWDTQSTRSDNPCFALHVPPILKEAERLAKHAFEEDREAIHISREYGVKKYEYVERTLKLKPVYLKSYSQLNQVLVEMRLAAMEPSAYLRARSPKKTIHYGARLSRALDTAYSHVGCTPDERHPTEENAYELNRKMRGLLATGQKISELLKELRNEHRKALDEAAGKLSGNVPSTFEEHFGLYLWLRSREQDSHEPRYALNLVGSSVVAKNDVWATVSDVPISPLSNYSIARALFAGKAEKHNLHVNKDPARWRGILSCPVRAWDDVVYPATAGMLTIGGISLNTNSYVTLEDLDTSKAMAKPISVLAVLPKPEQQGLQAELEAAAQGLLGLATR